MFLIFEILETVIMGPSTLLASENAYGASGKNGSIGKS